MEWWILGIIIVVSFLVLVFLGVPIAFTLGFLTLIYIIFFWPGALSQFALVPFGRCYDFMLVALPLFILMAEMLVSSRISDDAYDAVSKWVGWVPGGIGVASQVVCALFAACIGASAAAIATVGKIAVPEMLNRGYNKELATGSVAAGATLAQLIPPSIFMILYGILAEVSIGGLFIGGILPGLVLVTMFIIYIVTKCSLTPGYGPSVTGVSWSQRWTSGYKILPVLCLAIFLILAIYTGICTPTEVAGVGAFVAMLISIGYRRFNWQVLRNAIFNTVRTTTFIMWILFSAALFSFVLTRMGVTQSLCTWAINLPVSRYVVLAMVNILLLFLGCILDPAGILMITVPILVPLITALGFDPLWFGIMFVINMELALLTPPLGLNLFVVKGILPPERTDITLGDIIRGIIPFVGIGCIMLAIIIIFPGLGTWLPSRMIK